MEIYELIIDEDQEVAVEAISIVERPAIEEEFIALKDQQVLLAEVNKEKRLLVGALLVPNKPIYRKRGKEEYYIYFSKDTVRKAMELYLMGGKQNNTTLEHQHALNGISLVESWQVEHETYDKTKMYGLSVPLYAWAGILKVNNDEVWNDYVKTGKVKGFSIEGYFIDKMQRPKEPVNDFEEEAEELLSKVKQIVKNELSVVVNDTMAIIDDRLAYATKELAIKAAQDIGCDSYHEHEFEGKTWYMPCEQHQLKKPCQEGYEQYGMKRKNGKLVPNCIPVKK